MSKVLNYFLCSLLIGLPAYGFEVKGNNNTDTNKLYSLGPIDNLEMFLHGTPSSPRKSRGSNASQHAQAPDADDKDLDKIIHHWVLESDNDTINAIFNFYQGKLPKLGWRKLEYSLYEKENIQLELDINEKDRSAFLIFTFTPDFSAPIMPDVHE